MTTRGDFTRSEIAAANAAADATADASAQAQDDFRRIEIADMNAAAAAETRSRQLSTWGVVGLVAAAIVVGMMLSNPRSRK